MSHQGGAGIYPKAAELAGQNDLGCASEIPLLASLDLAFIISGLTNQRSLALVACTKVVRGDQLSDTWNGLRGEVRPMDTGPCLQNLSYTVYSIHAT